MAELYWITRLTAIHSVFVAILVIGCILSVISLLAYTINKCEEISACEGSVYEKEYKKFKDMSMSYFKYFIACAVFGIIGTVFIPTTKQALMIWGIGGTIDYIKSNPTAKQIPDKCIKALDKWVDSLSNDSTETKK